MVVKRNALPRIRVDIQFKQEWCKGCGYCAHVCERGVYAMRSTERTVSHMEAYVANPEKCVGCGYCELICPDNVIAVINSWGLNEARETPAGGKKTPKKNVFDDHG